VGIEEVETKKMAVIEMLSFYEGELKKGRE
jgi:hypothetical protein